MTEVLVVSALQLRHENNRELAERHAEQCVSRAAKKGARLILLPELYLTGYSFHAPDMWPRGERLADGPTVRWLQRQANTHRVCIATTLLEVEGLDYYNTFVLVGPADAADSAILGTARKARASSMEAFAFKDDPNTSHLIQLPSATAQVLGVSALTVGVLICYENMLARSVHYFTNTRKYPQAVVPDLLLCPFSGPSPPLSKHWSPEEAAQYDGLMQHNAARQAALYGVPCVMSNKVGPMTALMPWMRRTSLWRACTWTSKFLFPGPTAFMASCGVWETLGSWSYFCSNQRRRIAWHISHPDSNTELPFRCSIYGWILQRIAVCAALSLLARYCIRQDRFRLDEILLVAPCQRLATRVLTNSISSSTFSSLFSFSLSFCSSSSSCSPFFSFFPFLFSPPFPSPFLLLHLMLLMLLYTMHLSALVFSTTTACRDSTPALKSFFVTTLVSTINLPPFSHFFESFHSPFPVNFYFHLL
eukprot:g61815.t1